LVGQTIALCGLPPAGSVGRRHKTIACPTETSLSEQHWDKVKFFAENMGRRLEDREGLRRALDAGVNPSEETRRLALDTFFGDTLEDMIDSDFEIYKKIKDDPNFGALFRAVMYRRIAGVLQSRAAAV
jgi:hypothetical protein